MAILIRRLKRRDLDPLAEIYVESYKKVDIGEIWDHSTAKNCCLIGWKSSRTWHLLRNTMAGPLALFVQE